MDETLTSNWRIDKQIPIAVIFAMLMQSGAIIWWAAHMDSRVMVLEATSIQASLLLDRVSRMEEKVIYLKEATQDMSEKIETMIAKRH
jgi:hypothetical protein